MARLQQGRTDWFRIEAKAGTGTAKVLIYDEIGYWGVTASDLVAELDKLDVANIDLRLNSPGGDVFDGMAIYNALRNHPARVVATVDGLAASAASFIAMAADEVVMEKTGTMMIHDAISLAIGNAGDMRETADLLDKMSNTIADIYATKSGRDAAGYRDMMRAETWFNATEAVDAGLADRVAGADDATDADDGQALDVAARWDLSIFSFAGRDQAPAPVIPAQVTTPVATAPSAPVAFDYGAAIRNALEATR